MSFKEIKIEGIDGLETRIWELEHAYKDKLPTKEKFFKFIVKEFKRLVKEVKNSK